MEIGELIGKGVTAEVYQWGPDKVLKLYFDWVSDWWIENEAQVGRIVNEAGLPSPAVFELVNIDGRRGVVFQQIKGKSMLRHADAEPWNLAYYARRMARLQYDMHQCNAKELATQKEKILFTIEYSFNTLGNKVNKILDYFESLPDGESVCHGDLHFDNIIISDNELIAIDWTNTYRGNPLGDVARSCLMISSPTIPYGTSESMVIPYKFAKWVTYWAYLNEYIRIARVRFEDIDAWMLPVAAARLKENIIGEENWLKDIINYRLQLLN